MKKMVRGTKSQLATRSRMLLRHRANVGSAPASSRANRMTTGRVIAIPRRAPRAAGDRTRSVASAARTNADRTAFAAAITGAAKVKGAVILRIDGAALRSIAIARSMITARTVVTLSTSAAETAALPEARTAVPARISVGREDKPRR